MFMTWFMFSGNEPVSQFLKRGLLWSNILLNPKIENLAYVFLKPEYPFKSVPLCYCYCTIQVVLLPLVYVVSKPRVNEPHLTAIIFYSRKTYITIVWPLHVALLHVAALFVFPVPLISSKEIPRCGIQFFVSQITFHNSMGHVGFHSLFISWPFHSSKPAPNGHRLELKVVVTLGRALLDYPQIVYIENSISFFSE